MARLSLEYLLIKARKVVGEPKKLYHLTPVRNLVRIQRHGLRARSSRWGEGPRRTRYNRIYFTTSREDAVRSMLDVLRAEDVDLGGRSADTYALIMVDTAVLRDGRTWFLDPEHPHNSVYTTKRVLPGYIKVVEREVKLSRRKR